MADTRLRAIIESVYEKQGTDQAAAAFGQVGTASEQAAPKIKATGLSLTDLKSGLDLAKEAANAFMGVAKQAFEMGKEGATITATADSLNRLAQQSGYAGDLIENLEKAAGGTVDDLDYMGSTIRLLTGETGTFAKNLATAAPELLTMARAAVKLNPTLGDTATAYEAITRAIETGQVRALKDYGIIIDATGTKEERLQQILDKMPGLMDQVGGSVETATDKYTEFENSLDNVKDALGQTIDQMLKLEKVTSATQSFADYLDVSNQIQAAFEAGNITLKERNALVFRHDYLMQGNEKTLTELEAAIRENNSATEEAVRIGNDATATEEKLETARINAANAIALENGALVTFNATVVSAGKAEDDLADTTYRTADGFYELKAANDGVLGSIDFVSQAGKLLNDVLEEEGLTTSETNARKLEYLYTTGEITKAEYEDLMAKNLMIQRLENLNNALAGNIISQEQWQEILRDGIITVQELGQAMAETWSPTLDASIEASTQEFRDMYDVMGDLYYNTDQASSALVDFVAQAVESGTPLTTLAGGVAGVADQLTTGAQKAKELDDSLTNLDGRTVTATVITNFIANSGGGVGEGTGDAPRYDIRVGEPTGGATKTRGGLGDNPYLNDPRFQTMVALGMNPNTALNLLREADGLKGGGLGETSGFPMPSGGRPPIDTGGLPMPSGGGGTAMPPLGSGLVQNFILNLYSMATTENVTASFAALKAQAGVV